MGTPYLGEIKVISFNYAPRGWAFCNGQLLSIAQNTALFSLLGTTYGGDGRTTFALPNLQGRVPMHIGAGYPLGQLAGESAHTLTTTEMPAHQHGLMASADFVNTQLPSAAVLGAKPRGGVNLYAPPGSPVTPLGAPSISPAGSNQPHQNLQPYLTLNIIIALQGLFPSRN